MALLTATAGYPVAAAGDYAANDIVSNSASAGLGLPLQFNNMALGDGGPMTLVSGFISCSDDTLAWRIRLHLFNRTPTTATNMVDNTAKAMDNDDIAKYIGFLDFPAMVDMGEFAFAQVAEKQVGYRLEKGRTALFGVMETLDADTTESANMIVTVTLFAYTN